MLGDDFDLTSARFESVAAGLGASRELGPLRHHTMGRAGVAVAVLAHGEVRALASVKCGTDEDSTLAMLEANAALAAVTFIPGAPV
jgi:hypothetical protein